MTKDIQTFLSHGCGRCSKFATDDCKVRIWGEQIQLLRQIVLDAGLDEQMKWGSPCYTSNAKNVLMVSALKDGAVISFFKGVLLENDRLVKPGDNSQTVRYIKFTNTSDIQEFSNELKLLVYQAIEAEKAGLKVEFKKEIKLPKELLEVMNKDNDFKNAFYALTPGRQRGYAIYFEQPQKAETRFSRIEKYKPNILRGEGLNDKYSNKKYV